MSSHSGDHDSGGIGNCLSYVVSRSGKVLDSFGRVLGSGVATTNTLDVSQPRPLAVCENEPESFFSLATTALRSRSLVSSQVRKRNNHQLSSSKAGVSRKQRTQEWEDEVGSLDDIARAILRRHDRKARKTRLKPAAALEQSGGGSSQGTGYSERHRRLEQHLRMAISQMLVLRRWESGSREASAKWASWLLKMLRRAKPPPQALQRFLFTLSVAILPVMCCSLICQTLSILPDPEVLRSVDILCHALERSRSCFCPLQWEIMEERIVQCRQVRLKAGTWLERSGEAEINPSSLNVGRPRRRPQSNPIQQADCQSMSNSSEQCGVSNDEKMSNDLVLTEGVTALVRRALRERQILPPLKRRVPSADNSEKSVSTTCPLSGTRLKVPARGLSCAHLTCFDLQCYLEMNAEVAAGKEPDDESPLRAAWRCPLCGSDATWPQIMVDGFVLRILESLPENISVISIWPDGRWGAVECSDKLALECSNKARLTVVDDEESWSSQNDLSSSQGRNVKPRTQAWDIQVGMSKNEHIFHDFSEETSGLKEVLQDEDLSGHGIKTARSADVSRFGNGLCVTEASAGEHASLDFKGANVKHPLLHEINLGSLIENEMERTAKSPGCFPSSSELGLTQLWPSKIPVCAANFSPGNVSSKQSLGKKKARYKCMATRPLLSDKVHICHSGTSGEKRSSDGIE